MTEAPDVIYLQASNYHDETTWCEDRINDSDTKYIKESLILEHIPLLRKLRLAQLQRRASSLGPQRFVMYANGEFPGVCNALDENSPHAVSTVEEIEFWYKIGTKLISEFTQSHDEN